MGDLLGALALGMGWRVGDTSFREVLGRRVLSGKVGKWATCTYFLHVCAHMCMRTPSTIGMGFKAIPLNNY